MNRRIIYSRLDGGVSVVIPCRNIDEKNLTNEQIFQRAYDNLPGDAINPQIIKSGDIPQDRTFRNAWEHGGDKVQVNMEKAKEIHLERIRAVRDAKLEDLDAETMKAFGLGDAKAQAEVEARKQILRDLPQTLDLSKAGTPEELKAIWPDILPQK